MAALVAVGVADVEQRPSIPGSTQSRPAWQTYEPGWAVESWRLEAVKGRRDAHKVWTSSASDERRCQNVAAADNSDRPPLYWYDPMVPNQHFDKPGKPPFMDTQLVPKYADEGGAGGGVQISPNIVQNLGLRVAPVEFGRFSQPIEAVGNIGFNQRKVAIVQSRTSGFVSRVYGRAPADVLRRGAPLVDLLVPEWAGAQAEFLALVRSGDRDLIEAARQRLLLLGMPADLISHIEANQQQQATITIVAPIAGAIESLDIREGMTISAGATLAKINGLETVWLEAAIPEGQSGAVALGQSVEAQLAAYSGETVKGRVIASLPQLELCTLSRGTELSLRFLSRLGCCTQAFEGSAKSGAKLGDRRGRQGIRSPFDTVSY